MTPPRFPVYLFDVDGTLMDSAPDVCGAIQDVLRAEGRDDVTDEFLRGYIGLHLDDLFLDLNFERHKLDRMVTKYREIYSLRGHPRTRVFPGVLAMLPLLQGRKSTATTKPTAAVRPILEQFGVLPHLDHVQGTDNFPAKPAPDVILAALKALGARPEECLMVGDAPSDMEAGRRAGVKICAVRWGYGNPAELTRWQPDYWIDHPSDLLRARE